MEALEFENSLIQRYKERGLNYLNDEFRKAQELAD